MRTYRAIGSVCVFLATALPCRSAEQSSTRVCWRGRPSCGSFIVFETRIGVDLLNDLRQQIQLRVGVMHNLDSAWAVGGVASLRVGGAAGGYGLEASGRRWLDDDWSAQAESGISWGSGGAGLLVGAHLDWRHYASFWMEHGRAPGPPGLPSQRPVPPRPPIRTFAVGAGAGSTAALVPDGALLIYAIWSIANDPDAFGAGL